MPTTTFAQPVPEGSSRLYSAVLVDHTQQPIQPASVVSIALTLRDLRTGAVVNGRENQNVKNANGGTLAADGVFTMLFGPADTAMLDGATGERHKRRATFKVVSTQGAENHEVTFVVQNLDDV